MGRKPKNPLKYYREKADDAMQDYYRRQELNCEVCGGQYTCKHHFITKGNSAVLRYYEPNLISICNKCHCSHHKGNSKIHAEITLARGQEWFDDLMKENQKEIRTNIGYYKEIIKSYENK